jgi:ATP-dependent exoDNAse (exonuclease V) alpha subunit
MAIYHFSVKVISRSAGRSSVAAAAYRAGEKITNERDGLTHDYSNKQGVLHSEILLPENVPLEYADRAMLWNTVEQTEKRRDAQTARDVDFALPIELNRDEQIELAREFVMENFVDKGMIADLAIHDTGNGNPHAHVLLTMREVSELGFGKKNRDWNDKELLEQWRENWATACNDKFHEKGLDVSIDHRTLAEQGIDREPTIHLGRGAIEIGEQSERVQEQREIEAYNATRTTEAIVDYMTELRETHVIVDREITARKREGQDVGDLLKNRDEIEKEYQTQKLMSEARPDIREIKRELANTLPKSAREMLSRADSTRRLEATPWERVKEILRSIPQRWREMIERHRERTKERERLREWERGR